MDRLPPIEVRNAQRTISVSAPSLNAFAEIALSLAWSQRRSGSDITSIPAILVSVVSDKRMAQLHEEFAGVAGPTDVLTFRHGEILISVETAARQAGVYKTSLDEELRLYILHGLLHLCGYNDRTNRQRKAMERIQARLFKTAVLTTRRGTRLPTKSRECDAIRR